METGCARNLLTVPVHIQATRAAGDMRDAWDISAAGNDREGAVRMLLRRCEVQPREQNVYPCVPLAPLPPPPHLAPIPFPQVLHIGAQVARALSYLHPTVMHRGAWRFVRRAGPCSEVGNNEQGRTWYGTS